MRLARPGRGGGAAAVAAAGRGLSRSPPPPPPLPRRPSTRGSASSARPLRLVNPRTTTPTRFSRGDDDHHHHGDDGHAAASKSAATTANAARLLTSRLARCRSSSEVREALASSHELNATHVAAAMSACARLAKRTRRRRREEGDDADDADDEARQVAQELYARLRVAPLLDDDVDESDTAPHGLSITPATTKTPITLRDAASILASAASLGVGVGTGKTSNSRTSLALLDAASRADNVDDHSRSAESVSLALWAAARMRLPAPDEDDASLLLSRLLLLPSSTDPWPSTHAATTIIALSQLLPRWQRELANARRQKMRRGAQQEAQTPVPPPRLTLPPGWLDGALRATLPLLQSDQDDDADYYDEKEDDFTASSLLKAAAALAPFSEQGPRRRNNRRRSSLSTLLPAWWASAWLLAAERRLPDASAAQLTRTFDALASSGSLDAWPADDESDESESDDSTSLSTLRQRQVRFMRAAYGQLYYTADQFTPRQLGLLLSKGALGAAAPAPLATRLAAYALAKAAAVVKTGQASTASEACDAVSGAGFALQGLAEVHRGKKNRRRRKGKAPPPPPPPLDPRLLLAARAAVLEPGVEALLLAKGHDDDGTVTNAIVDLLAGMAALKRVIAAAGDEEEEEEGDAGDEEGRPLLILLSQGSSRLSPQQVSSLLDALIDLGLLQSSPQSNTASSLWLRQLLRASALRLRACRDAGAVVSVAASVARLCSSSNSFHPGRSWTLRTLMPAVAAAVVGARPSPATTTTLLVRSLAVLLTPLVVDSSSSSTIKKLPFDRARLVAQLRAAVDRGTTAAAAATPRRSTKKQQEEQEDKVAMRRHLAAVEAALEKLG